MQSLFLRLSLFTCRSACRGKGKDEEIMIAYRMSKLDSSGIRKVFDLAQKMQNPVNLSIGQPDFDVPGEIKTEAIKAINDGFNKYTVTQGTPELRDALLKRLQK